MATLLVRYLRNVIAVPRLRQAPLPLGVIEEWDRVVARAESQGLIFRDVRIAGMKGRCPATTSCRRRRRRSHRAPRAKARRDYRQARLRGLESAQADLAVLAPGVSLRCCMGRAPAVRSPATLTPLARHATSAAARRSLDQRPDNLYEIKGDTHATDRAPV